MKASGRKTALLLLLIAAGIGYTVCAYLRCGGFKINSDFANLVLEGKDILRGNFFRKDWNLTGISFLWTDLFYFTIGTLVFGVSEKAFLLAYALMQTAFVAAALLLVKDRYGRFKLLNTILLFVFILIPNDEDAWLRSAHTGMFTVSFLLILLYEKMQEKPSRLLQAAYILLLALTLMSDPTIALLTTVPVCLQSIVLWLKKKQETAETAVRVAINAFGIVLGVLLDKLYFLIGGANKNAFLGGKIFVPLDMIREKCIIYVRCLLGMTDAVFEEQPLFELHTFYALLNVLPVLLFFGLILYHIVCFLIGKEYDTVTLLLGLGFLTLSAVFILTSIAQDVAGGRYLCYFPALMGIVFIRNAGLLKDNERLRYTAVFLLVFVLLIRGYEVVSKKRPEPMPQELLAECLEEKGLQNGYASFWNASCTTVVSGEKVTVRAVEWHYDQLRMYNWCCKNAWYNEYADFVVTKDDDEAGVTRGLVESTLGAAKEIVSCGEYTILIYDHDISDHIQK